jgi:hypothetical protein
VFKTWDTLLGSGNLANYLPDLVHYRLAALADCADVAVLDPRFISFLITLTGKVRNLTRSSLSSRVKRL